MLHHDVLVHRGRPNDSFISSGVHPQITIVRFDSNPVIPPRPARAQSPRPIVLSPPPSPDTKRTASAWMINRESMHIPPKPDVKMATSVPMSPKLDAKVTASVSMPPRPAA